MYIKKWVFATNVHTNANGWFMFSITPSIVAKKGHHFISIGPKIFMDPYIDSYKKTLGFDMSYRFYTSKMNKRTRLFFPFVSDIAQFHRYSEGWSTGDFAPPVYKHYSRKFFMISAFMGCGFDVRIFQRFHLSQFIAFGIIHEKSIVTYSFPDDPSKNSSGQDKLAEKAGMLNIGIGFDFVKRNKAIYIPGKL